MNFGKSPLLGIDDDGMELQGWLFERMVQRKRKLRDLFLARHSDVDSCDETIVVNSFDVLG